MQLLTALEIWAVFAPAAGFMIGANLPRIKQVESAVVAEARAIVSEPVFSERDEFLDENYQSFSPQQLVPEGMNPVAASRERTRVEGKTFHTRRI